MGAEHSCIRFLAQNWFEWCFQVRDSVSYCIDVAYLIQIACGFAIRFKALLSNNPYCDRDLWFKQSQALLLKHYECTESRSRGGLWKCTRSRLSSRPSAQASGPLAPQARAYFLAGRFYWICFFLFHLGLNSSHRALVIPDGPKARSGIQSRKSAGFAQNPSLRAKRSNPAQRCGPGLLRRLRLLAMTAVIFCASKLRERREWRLTADLVLYL